MHGNVMLVRFKAAGHIYVILSTGVLSEIGKMQLPPHRNPCSNGLWTLRPEGVYASTNLDSDKISAIKSVRNNTLGGMQR